MKEPDVCFGRLKKIQANFQGWRTVLHLTCVLLCRALCHGTNVKPTVTFWGTNTLSPFGEQIPWLSLSKDKHAALQIILCNMSLEILKGNSRVTFIWCLFIFKEISWGIREEDCGCNWRPVLGHSWWPCISFLVAIACSLCVLHGWNKCFHVVTV